MGGLGAKICSRAVFFSKSGSSSTRKALATGTRNLSGSGEPTMCGDMAVPLRSPAGLVYEIYAERTARRRLDRVLVKACHKGK